MLGEVQSNCKRHVVEVTTKVTHLFTDASLKGFGAVAFLHNGRVATMAGAWSGNAMLNNINELETFAVERALWSLDMDEHVFLHVDNTTAIAAFKKRRSKNYAVNFAVLRSLQCKYKIVGICYVKSKENVADPFSRMFQ